MDANSHNQTFPIALQLSNFVLSVMVFATTSSLRGLFRPKTKHVLTQSDIAAVLLEVQGEITQLEIEINTHKEYHMPLTEAAREEAKELGTRYAALRYTYTRQTRQNADSTITSMEIVIDNHKAALRLKKRVSELRDDVSRTSKKYNPSLSSRTDLSVVDDEPSSTPPDPISGSDSPGLAASILYRCLRTISGRRTHSRQTPEYPGNSQPETNHEVTVTMRSETEAIVFTDQPGGPSTMTSNQWIGQTLDAMPEGREFESGIQRAVQEPPFLPHPCQNNSSISIPWEQ